MNKPGKLGVEIGDILAGKYRVEKILGAGGMGVVVAATHIDLQDVRAIKLMRPAERDNRHLVERFLREARAAVKLRSEHVAEVYDVGRLESGEPYIVMELLSGHDLSVFTKNNSQLPIERAVLYVFQACDALAEAHAAGIIHRDLKPANLFLTTRTDGSPCIKVLDFGISKHANHQTPSELFEMTKTAEVMGSPAYMSPEQMRSARDVDARTDIWALGAILYRLLAGRTAFPAPTPMGVFMEVLEGKPPSPPSVWRPDLPNELDAVVMHCLERDVSARMPTVSQLRQALKPFTLKPSPRTGAAGPARRETPPPIARPPSIVAQPVVPCGNDDSDGEENIQTRVFGGACAGVPKPDAAVPAKSEGDGDIIDLDTTETSHPQQTLTPHSDSASTAPWKPGRPTSVPRPAQAKPGEPAKNHSQAAELQAARNAVQAPPPPSPTARPPSRNPLTGTEILPPLPVPVAQTSPPPPLSLKELTKTPVMPIPENRSAHAAVSVHAIASVGNAVPGFQPAFAQMPSVPAPQVLQQSRRPAVAAGHVPPMGAAAMAAPGMNGHANGYANGHASNNGDSAPLPHALQPQMPPAAAAGQALLQGAGIVSPGVNGRPTEHANGNGHSNRYSNGHSHGQAHAVCPRAGSMHGALGPSAPVASALASPIPGAISQPAWMLPGSPSALPGTSQTPLVSPGMAREPAEPRHPSGASPSPGKNDRLLAIACIAGAFAMLLISRLAKSDLPVLILGETGTGKEIAALAVHHWSSRTRGRFVAVNCGAISDALMENELFGHEPQAFTGATTSKAGLIERAAGGTLFLDELGELSPAAQAKLLRVLETKRLRPVGGVDEREVDFRLVAATNRDPEAAIRDGKFREDLWQRLKTATVTLPPLRDRPREVPILARRFFADARDERWNREAREARSKGETRAEPPRGELSDAVMVRLSAYRWPGNVRELKNAMEFVASLMDGDRAEMRDLPPDLLRVPDRPSEEPSSEPPPEPEGKRRFAPLYDEVQQLERRRIEEALLEAGGVQAHAAKLLDMPQRTFAFKLKQYNIDAKRFDPRKPRK